MIEVRIVGIMLLTLLGLLGLCYCLIVGLGLLVLCDCVTLELELESGLGLGLWNEWVWYRTVWGCGGLFGVGVVGCVDDYYRDWPLVLMLLMVVVLIDGGQ